MKFNKIFKLIILISFVLFSFIERTSGQVVREFPSDSTYLNDLSVFMTKVYHDKGEQKVNRFSAIWNSDKLTSAQKDSILSFSNQLLEKNARSFPHFGLFLETYIAFSESAQDIDSYNNWESQLIKMLYDPRVYLHNMSDFFEFTIELLKNNTLYKSGSATWVSSESGFHFEYTDFLKVVIENTDLRCYFSSDSTGILNTSGYLIPDSNLWIGNKGKILWNRSGIHEDSVFVELKNYQLRLRSSEYKIDSVYFFNRNFSDEPIPGSVEDKVVVSPDTNSVRYPKFESYDKDIVIKDFVKDIDYKGGYSMHGRFFIGSGTEKNKAMLTIHKGDSLLMTAKSINFGIRNNQIIAYNTEIVIPIEQDSLFHKNLLFKYFIGRREIALIRNKRDLSQSFYKDTYHNFFMDVELVNWKIDSTEIIFHCLPGATRNKAEFRSTNFFSENEYYRLQGIDNINPLSAVRAYSNRYRTEEFTAQELAKDMRRSLRQVHQMLIRLSFLGFIDYDIEEKRIKVLPLLEHYVLSRVNRKDYDIINVQSDTVPSVPNAILNMQTKDLQINGADSIPLNAKLRKKALRVYGEDTVYVEERVPVTIKPDDDKLVMKKDRNFEFDGEITLGNFQFVGKQFSFDYDKYRVNLDSADYLSISIDKVDSLGRPIPGTEKVKNKIEDISGYVLIDEPDNKSGNISNPEYPIFHSLDTSFIYYDDSTVQEVTYPRDRFQFQIDPYVVDSLYEFSTNDWALPGTFASGGIIPTIREEIRIVKDSTEKFGEKEYVPSFGFEREIKPEGIDLYQGKGLFFSDLKLSMKGLRGNGIIEYITSTTKSNDFVFYMDSMITQAYEFYNTNDNAYQIPSASAQNIFQQWYPKEDYQLTSSRGEPFELYYKEKLLADSIKLTGTLKLEPRHLSGWGMMEFENSELESGLFKYKDNYFDADTANFALRSLTGDALTFQTQNVKSHIDLAGKKGTFRANNKSTSYATFPQNQYICYMGAYTWYMDMQKIDVINDEIAYDMPADTSDLSFNQKEDLSLVGSRFVSIHPNQDSLSFFSPNASYDMQKSLITANQVKYIRVADATIYPTTPVVIREAAKMNTLENTTIVADTTNRLHTISDARATIYGKFSYIASGKYEYIDYEKTKQLITFDSIYVDSMRTVADGLIKEEQRFRLSPEFSFEGNVHLSANEKYLTFSGYTEISHNCQKYNIKTNKYHFTAKISPDEIYIPITKEMKDIDNRKIYAGLMLNKDSAHIYTTFLTAPKYWGDKLLLTADGFLNFDREKNIYKIAKKEKLLDRKLSGNYIEFNKDLCNFKGEGKLDLGLNLGQIQLDAAGMANQDIPSDNTEFDIYLGIDFFFPKQAVEIMGRTFQQATTMEGIDIASQRTKKVLREVISEEDLDQIIEDLILQGEYKVPETLEHTITFTQLKLEWNSVTQSYLSYDKIGIGNVGDIPVNRYVDGFAEFIKRRTGDVLNIYLRIDRERWFFFTYKRGDMQSISSIDKYNNIIIDTKEKKRQQKVKRNEPEFAFYPSTNTIKNKFLTKFMAESEIDDVRGNEQVIEIAEEEEEEESGGFFDFLDSEEEEKAPDQQEGIFDDNNTGTQEKKDSPTDTPADESIFEEAEQEPEKKKKRNKKRKKKQQEQNQNQDQIEEDDIFDDGED